MSRRVVVTGVGMVTPLGVGKNTFSQKLFKGNSGICPITYFDTARFPSSLGAQVSDFSPGDFISRKNLRKMDRLSRMAAASLISYVFPYPEWMKTRRNYSKAKLPRTNSDFV